MAGNICFLYPAGVRTSGGVVKEVFADKVKGSAKLYIPAPNTLVIKLIVLAGDTFAFVKA